MIFSSVEFLALFLPLFFIAYLATPGRVRNTTLCCGSWLFYAWWSPMFLPLIVGITAIAWRLGKAIERAQEGAKRPLVTIGVIAVLACLAWFKYANLLVDTLNGALSDMGTGTLPWSAIILPIALSFTVLQAISYLIDVRRGVVAAEPSFVSFAAYLDMFPHLISGPIIRYSWVDRDLTQRRITLDDLAIGARRFMLGFAVKVLIADTLAPLVEAVFALRHPTLVDSWLGNLGFALQIYFDFAGYSAMAIGLGRMLGFHYPENFRDPYLSTTIQDFWRRWHISLSSWLRDYLYIPLGGNRKGEARTYTNLMLTMAIGGLWHGASWSFLLWGVIHGVALAVARWWNSYGPRVSTLVTFPLTLLVVLLAWTPFRATTWGGTLAMLAGQIGLNGIGISDQIAVALRPIEVVWFVIGGVVVVWPALRQRFLPRLAEPEWWAPLWPCLVFLYSIAVMMGHQTVPFLYFQF